MKTMINNGIFGMLKGSPIAVALLIMYWLGNSQWGMVIDKVTDKQAQFNQKIAEAMDKLAITINDVHTDLDHVSKNVGPR